jgi:membrane-associated phospholipid phosphatase
MICKQILFLCLAATCISYTNGQDTVSAKVNQTRDTAVFNTTVVSVDSGRNIATIDSTKDQPVISADTRITGNKNATPYATSFKKDAPVIIAGVGLTALGAALIRNKKDLTPEELNSKTRDDVPFFDRGNVGYYSQKADKDSYVPFHISFGLPILTLLLDNNERSHFGQVLVMYTETMAITGALFTMAAGTVQRSRPFVYGTEAPLYQRLSGNNQRSFFAGHTAATAAATFFTAKVFQDFHPHSSLNPFIWIVAASVPAAVGYLRYKAGMHFLSDNIIGYLVGAGTGILIPQWHKIKALKNVNISAQSGKGGYQEILLSWRF